VRDTTVHLHVYYTSEHGGLRWRFATSAFPTPWTRADRREASDEHKRERIVSAWLMGLVLVDCAARKLAEASVTWRAGTFSGTFEQSEVAPVR